MKSFLPFLFLLSFACYGQAGTWGKSTSAEPYGFLPDTPSVKQLSLEEKLLLYAQECWEDSSKYCYWQWYNGNYIKEGVPCVCGSEYCLEKYIHRKPTFEGFIEWLKKK